jgi:predicted ATPase
VQDTAIVREGLVVKLAKVSIENFRNLGTTSRPFEVEFTDVLDRVHDFTLLVGPNASGKTTILDAIAAALGPSLGMPTRRPGFELSPRGVVRRGALHAKVTCWLRFSPEEIAATRELFQLASIGEEVPDEREVKVTWTYPDPRKPSAVRSGYASTSSRAFAHDLTLESLSELTTFFDDNERPSPQGFSQYESASASFLLPGRLVAARLLSTGRTDWASFDRVGGVFTFDQERTGLGKTVSRQVWNIIHGTEAARENEDLRTADPRTILIDLALQSLVPTLSSTGQQPNDFQRIQERYARICAPRRLVGAVRDELGEFDVSFTDGENGYTYEGLSSGEKNVLLLLIRFVAERIHRSVVLIDELELNQHPIWQRKLLYLLPRMGDDNQIIATTHSPYLRDAVNPDAVIDLGSLDHGAEEGH